MTWWKVVSLFAQNVTSIYPVWLTNCPTVWLADLCRDWLRNAFSYTPGRTGVIDRGVWSTAGTHASLVTHVALCSIMSAWRWFICLNLLGNVSKTSSNRWGQQPTSLIVALAKKHTESQEEKKKREGRKFVLGYWPEVSTCHYRFVFLLDTASTSVWTYGHTQY